MTKHLDKAFAEARKLPADQQDALAARLLEELAGDRRWDDLLARSTDLLDELVEEALAEHRAGKTKPLDPERMR
jgi:hypothetical protein